ncbi:type I secretion system permease/ATPase [Thioclava nitratireducens]|uniref:type I secretion system permease/ATPase n=1 Tax=Thioclava nitratireducens TaxID=1915078 RepID=UPI002480BF1D|nr:type I secretion system permease/ATPase [Thioclava nitratireducens]WGT52269.1 type I secretion system permease/ATPase [Thioclava nitratireducens]
MPYSNTEEAVIKRNIIKGRREMARLLRGVRGQFALVAIFAAFINVLVLAGPLFMLQVYDRVLPARSLPTLINLFLLVAFLFMMMGVLDWARGRLLARIGADHQRGLERRVFDAAIVDATVNTQERSSNNALRDLEILQRYYASPVAAAVFDLPWTPLYLGVLFVFHPWLGALAFAGGAALILLSFATQFVTRARLDETAQLENKARYLGNDFLRQIETIVSLGMRESGFKRWQAARHESMSNAIHTTDVSGSFHAVMRALRLLLQTSMLALGAYLVLQGEVSAGAMVAASILMGRALAPVELAVGGWTQWQGASLARDRLAALLGAHPPERKGSEWITPKPQLTVEGLTIRPATSDRATLDMISFSLEPGEALGVIGPLGAGKSVLARSLCNFHRPSAGTIRLDDVPLDQYDRDNLGRLIGYLPQSISFFPGTVAENIARLDPAPDKDRVIAAAKRAGAHQMILKLPAGYDTPIEFEGASLSDRQRQLVALSRALYHDPILLVLDEPNLLLNGDAGPGLQAMLSDLKAHGGAAIVMTNSPGALAECDRILVLDRGAQRALGARDDVLKRMIASATKSRVVPAADSAA